MATIKQKKAIQEIVVNGSTIKDGMRKAGYSETTSHRTNKLTRTKGWAELMEQYLPDKLLAEKHKELLLVPKKFRTYVKGDLTSETEELDSNAIGKGLDMGYKLKGRYAPDKTINLNLEVGIKNEDLELAHTLNEAIRRTNKKPTQEGVHSGGHKPSEGSPASPVGGEVPNKE